MLAVTSDSLGSLAIGKAKKTAKATKQGLICLNVHTMATPELSQLPPLFLSCSSVPPEPARVPKPMHLPPPGTCKLAQRRDSQKSPLANPSHRSIQVIGSLPSSIALLKQEAVNEARKQLLDESQRK